jgi:putative addiction module CopG family antidote
MTIQLPPDVEAIVKAKVASGAFPSESEVVAAAVRWFEAEGQRNSKREELQALIREGAEDADRGDVQDLDEAFDEVEVELFGKRIADE